MTASPRPNLECYVVGDFTRGRSAIVEALWIVLQGLFVTSFVPGSGHRRWLLRLFGAQIGAGVVVKPGVRVKFPWRLTVGDHSWIGEDVWIDNLAPVTIGANVVLSQGAYLCTGSHDWRRASFDLLVQPITVADGAWVCARATVAPGTVLGEGAVLALASLGRGTLDPWTVYVGHPATAQRFRKAMPNPQQGCST